MSESDATGKDGTSLGRDAAARLASELLGATANGPEVVEIEAGSGDPRSEENRRCPGGWRFVRRLGVGGGGEVVEAVREGGRESVALKWLHGPHGDAVLGRRDPAWSRAWRELELLRDVRLPCVPCLVDYGTDGGRVWIATELVHGRRIDEHADGEGLDRRSRTILLADLADAVHALHERGVIHRDLKPSNVLVDPDDRPVIVDLGIARLVDEASSDVTATGAVIGSALWMAPEQARGESAAIGTRADVYGVGAIGYALLTGAPPHDPDASFHELVRRAAQDDPRDPRAIDATMPRPLAAILRRATARRPRDRYESAAALAADLRRWLAGEPVEAGGSSTARRLLRAVVARPILATSVVCGAMIVASIATAFLVVFLLTARPAAVEWDRGGHRWARVTSFAGATIHRWDIAGSVGVIEGAGFIPAEPEVHDDPLAVVGFSNPYWDPALENRLAVFRHGAYDEPWWVSGTTKAELAMPAPPSPVGAGIFRVVEVLVADVLPERPGTEIVAVHNHHMAPSVIRTYAADGEVVASSWHYGHVRRIAWLPEPGLIVAAAYANGIDWTSLGVEPPRPGESARVVFAVRPADGRRDDGFIQAPGGHGTIPPVWYRFVGPPRTLDALAEAPEEDAGYDFDLETPRRGGDPARMIQVTLTARMPREPSLGIVLDEAGRPVPDQRTPSEAWRTDPRLPPHATIWIRSLPSDP